MESCRQVPPGELGSRATPTPCLHGASFSAGCRNHCPMYTSDKPQSVAKHLPRGKGSSRASGSPTSSLALQRLRSSLALQRLRGEQYVVLQWLPLHQTACRPCSSSHNVCVQQPSHAPVHGKSIRHREYPTDSAHTLCSLHLAQRQLTDKPIPPATNQQRTWAALTHTYTLAGPSHANRAARWWGTVLTSPISYPRSDLTGKV